MMLKIFSMLAAFAAASTISLPSARADSPVDLPHAWPRPGADMLIDNDRGTAWNIKFEEGVGAHWHKHLYQFVGVDLTNSGYEVTNPDGVTAARASYRGRMWILPKGLTHMERGLTTPGRNILIVDLKETSSAKHENKSEFPEGFRASNAAAVNDTDRLIQWDVTWKPAVAEAPSFHSRDTFVAIVEGGQLKITSPGKPPELKAVKTGEAIFLPGGEVRTIESAEGEIRAMVVELK